MSATAGAAAGIGVLASFRAFGFSLAEPNAEEEALIAGRCSVNKQPHEALIAELTAKLQGLPEAEVKAAIAATICPICGCPVG